jgi:ribonucleoside-diphosphate reductase beta chain
VAYHTLDSSTNNKDHVKSLAFLDDSGTTTVARYDRMKYRVFDRLTEEQLSFFWRPQEIELNKDANDFRKLTAHEQHIFTANLKRQIVLDSVQGRAPNTAFLPLCSLPELEIWIQTWAFSETIHSKSYTHIIRNIYSDPSKVLDELMNIQEIADCARDITQHYDNLINYTMQYHVLGEGVHIVNGQTITISKRELKKRIWMALNSVNALEGVRFYVSFACSFAFAELKKMEGNAKIIKLICRDENLHLGSTQTLIKLLPKDDPEFADIRDEMALECQQLFESAVAQEIAWADYLFKDGSMIGLNAPLLKDYVEYIAGTRMESIGIPSTFGRRPNPLPWTQKWISGKEVQVSPQEVELSSYRIGDAKMDVTDKTFSGMTL